MLSTNQTLQNRFRILSQLGQIDSGLGYTAFDGKASKEVLLIETLADPKVLPGNPVPPTVRHQSLLCVTENFIESGKNYLVMDHTEGRTLGELLEKKRSPFPVKDVALWSDGLLDALNHLHSQQPPLIHSNIKPQNIRLSPGGNVKLMVFGSNDSRSVAADVMTFDATVLGYFPMEQIWLGLDVGSRKVIRSGYDEQSAEILEQPLDVQSDVFSMAATIYHLLTGRVPVDALTRSIDILEGKPDPLVPATNYNPAVPAEVSEILSRAMQIKREDRYGSASILRQVLRSAFARIKDEPTRAMDGAEDDAVLELPAARPAPEMPKPAPPPIAVPSAPPRPAEQSAAPRVGMQSGESRQLEIIKRQLREAEARRLEAEKRAAEAEKKLQERETFEFKLAEVAAEMPKPEPVPQPVAAVAAVPVAAATEESFGDDEFDSMFDEVPTGGKSMAKVAGAAAGLLVLAGVAWGVWTYTSAAPEAATPAPIVADKQPAPTAESNPATESPVVTTASENQPVPVESAVTDEPRPVVDPKAKPTQTPPQQAKKQPTPTPKTNEPQKKSVTLDDLLKDN